jgi:hypothetical protein
LAQNAGNGRIDFPISLTQLFYFGARALTLCITPPVSCSVAVTIFGGVFETNRTACQ